MPTFAHGSSAKFYQTDIATTERDLSTAVTSVSFPRSADTAEATSLGDTSKAYIAGLKDATIAVEGNRDVTIEGYVDGVLGAGCTFAYLPAGSASGRIKYSGSAICTSYEPASDVGDANKWSASYQVTGAVTRTTL